MPYNIINPGSVEDAWKNGSVMDMVNNQAAQLQGYTGNIDLANRPVVQNPDGSVSTVRSMSFNEDGKEILIPTVSQNGTVMTPQQAIDEYHRTGQNLGVFDSPESATAMAKRIHDQQAYGLNSVFNQTRRAENPQPIPTQPTTQIANQGMNRRPTVEEYTARAIKYLRENGYSNEDAMELMAPSIATYKAEYAAQNRAMADNLIADMQNMKIDSPEYRQAALQLYRLDPKMGEFMLKEGIGPREQYLRGQKREDTVFANEMNFKNYLRKLGVQSERQQKAIADKIQQLVEYGGMDRNTATQMVLFGGGRNGGRRTATDDGGVSEKDYKMVTGRLKELLAKQDEGMQTNPDYRLSASEQDEFNRLSQIANLAKQQLYQKYNVGQQQPKQQAKLDPNNYYSFGPLLQDLVKRNGGMSKDVARALRARLGFNPDDNSPNNFVNQVMKREYGFSG